MAEVIEVIGTPVPVIEVIHAGVQVVEVPEVVGPRGPVGPAGPAGGGTVLTYTQSIPSASWSIAHPFGRIPAVQVYIDGVQVDTDITASDTHVSVVFPSPTTGIAILT